MLREFTASIQKQNFTPEQGGDVYDPDKRLKKEAMKKRVEARIAAKKLVSEDLQLKKIISGMQKNVDQYGIEAAKELGIDYGGTVNKGFKVVPEGNNSPNFQEFVDSGKWEEIKSQSYPDRTKANAQNADGTVWFGKTGTDSAGHNATKKYSGNKPWIENPTDKELRQWLIDNNIETLNVAGNRSYGTEELGQQAKETIVKAVQGDIPTSKNTLKIYYPYANKNKTINHANSYKQIVEAQNPGLTVELVNNKSQADMVFGRGQGMGNPFSHESSHSEVIVKTRFFDETMIMYEAWLKGEPMPEGTVPITPEQQKKLDALKAEWDNKLKPFVSSSSFETVKRYSVEDLRNNPNKIYIFGDNTEGWGKGGQAIVRDEPNAFGISTKDSPTQFMSDDNFEANKAKIDADIAAIKADGRPIVFPEDGIGTGRADLQNKAPRTWAYLQKELNKLKGDNTKVKTFEVSTKGDDFGKQFSALNATFKEGPYAGRTVEDVWQNEIKKSGKGKPPSKNSILFGSDIMESKVEYQKLWEMWLRENPESMKQLKNKVNEGFTLVDSFAGDPSKTVNQAEALTNIINQDNFGASLGAAKLNDPNVFNEVIEEYTPGNKFIKEIVGNIPGWIIVPIEQAIESGLRMSGYSAAAALAKKLVQWELYTFAVSLGANAIGRGEGALVSPQLAQAHLILGNEEEFRKRAATMEKDMMQNSAEVGSGMMSAIIKAMPSYWKDEWLLKRNPEFTGWMEMFPDLAYVKTKAEKGMDWGIGKLFGNGK